MARSHPPAGGAGAEGEEVSDGSSNVAARLLILCWVIAIVGGFFVSLVMSVQAFRDGNTTSGIVLGAIAIGCAVYFAIGHISRATSCGPNPYPSADRSSWVVGALSGDRMKAVFLVLLLVTSATPGLAAGDLTKLSILKAKEILPAVAGIHQLANWKGQSKPIIVDIETVANGQAKCIRLCE
jgi:hypothetical protein